MKSTKGVVTHVAVDEGSIDLDVTSAETMLDVVRPTAKRSASALSADGDDSPPAAALGLLLVPLVGWAWSSGLLTAASEVAT